MKKKHTPQSVLNLSNHVVNRWFVKVGSNVDSSNTSGIYILLQSSMIFMAHILGDVSEVMSSPVITVSPDQSLSTTTQRLLNEEVGSIVVTTETLELEGIVTKTDLLEGYARCETPSEQPISDMMSTSVVTIEPDRPLSTAARRLDNNGIKHLVVVNDSDILNELGPTTKKLIEQVPPTNNKDTD
jgi:CBS domain-containing protein